MVAARFVAQGGGGIGKIQNRLSRMMPGRRWVGKEQGRCVLDILVS